MKTLEIKVNGELKEFSLPEKWNEITVETYQKITDIDTELRGVFLSIELVSIVTGLSRDLIDDLDIEDFNLILDTMNFLNRDVPKLPKKSVKIDGDTYHIKKDFNKFKVGEIASIDMILSEAEGNFYKVMPKLLCVYLRKAGEEKFDSEFLSREELFKKLPITDVIDLFFHSTDGKES